MLSAHFASLSEFPLFTIESKLKEVQLFLSLNPWSHIPIVNSDKQWIGNLVAEDILNADSELIIEDVLYDLEVFYLTEEYNPLQYFDIFAKYDSTVIPLLNEQGNIAAIVLKEPLMQQWASIDFITATGTTCIVETEVVNFSFSQISQIIEGNNAKLLGLVQLNANYTSVQLLFKTNGVNTKTILNDLRRFEYNILSKHSEDTYNTDLLEKSAYLTKYLNI